MLTTEQIDVCVCTFQRTSLFATLDSIGAQRLPAGVSLRTIVADNDETDRLRAEVDAHARKLSLDLTYVHAPHHNISRARNACLDAAHNDWLAFIDDDETAETDWMEQLLSRRDGVQFVFGVSQAEYRDDRIPEWIVKGDYHSNRIAGNDLPWNGYTSNVLMDRAFVEAQGLRFLEALGQTGGEDTVFFASANHAGARFNYAPGAVVHEEVSLARANFAWIARRRYRSGQTHALLHPGFSSALAALAKSAACLVQAAAFPVAPAFGRRAALRAILHVGVVASALGFSPHREYGDAHRTGRA